MPAQSLVGNSLRDVRWSKRSGEWTTFHEQDSMWRESTPLGALAEDQRSTGWHSVGRRCQNRLAPSRGRGWASQQRHFTDYSPASFETQNSCVRVRKNNRPSATAGVARMLSPKSLRASSG